MRKTLLSISSITLCCACLSLALLSRDSSAADLQLPKKVLPAHSGSAIQIDEEYLKQKAEDYCAAPLNTENSIEKSSADFIMGALPITAFNDLCGQSDEEIRKTLGNLYVSGLLGGIWLRTSLRNNAADVTAFSQLLQASAQAASGLKLNRRDHDKVPAATFPVWNLLAESALNLSQKPLKKQKPALFALMPPFLFVTGYNKGYLDHILAFPPDQVTPPTDYISCTHFLDCKRPGLELAPFEQYMPVVDALNQRASTDRRWGRMQTAIRVFGEGSQAAGAGVWKFISVKKMSPEAYALLIDLSAKFLMISEVSLLASIDAINENDAVAGRCALRQQAAMTVWMGSYFSGLASPRSRGAAAQLRCGN